MITREEYEKTYIRMMDSLRSENKGSADCLEVKCKNCPLSPVCYSSKNHSIGFNAFKVMEIVEQWGKEHPIVTNADKFKEVFGHLPVHSITGELACPGQIGRKSVNECRKCNDCNSCEKSFWEAEYVAPKLTS